MPSKMSAVWFPRNERVTSTMIGANMSIGGCIIGFFLPGIMVTSHVLDNSVRDEDEISDRKDTLQHEITMMMLVMALAETVLLIVLFFFFKRMVINKYGHRAPDEEGMSISTEEVIKKYIKDADNRTKLLQTNQRVETGTFDEAGDPTLRQKLKEIKEPSFREQMRILSGNKNYWLILISSSLVINSCYVFSTVME